MLVSFFVWEERGSAGWGTGRPGWGCLALTLSPLLRRSAFPHRAGNSRAAQLEGLPVDRIGLGWLPWTRPSGSLAHAQGRVMDQVPHCWSDFPACTAGRYQSRPDATVVPSRASASWANLRRPAMAASPVTARLRSQQSLSCDSASEILRRNLSIGANRFRFANHNRGGCGCREWSLFLIGRRGTW